MKPLLAALLLVAGTAHAQTLTGTAGLLTIPTAEMYADGTAMAGVGVLHRDADPYQRGQSNVAPYYASITFLPFLELGFRFTTIVDERDALGDRMLMIRARLLSETATRPAVALGLHDFFRSTSSETRRYNALYLVASKNLSHWLGLPLSAHLGYGSDVMSAKSHQYAGLFGGLDYTLLPETAPLQAHLLAEYDGDLFALGTRLRYRWLYALAALHDFHALSGGAGLRVVL